MKNKNALLLFALTTCWGPSFMLIKVAVEEISPMMLAALRIALGAIFLLTLLLFRQLKFPRAPRFWRDVLVTGFFAQALPFSLINWGEQYVDSSLASLLNGLTPLSTVVLAHVMLQDEKMSSRKLIGVLFGIGGLFLLVLPELSKGFNASLLGIIAISTAALSYGIGLVYARKHFCGLDPLLAPSAQLTTVALYLLPLAYFLEPVDFAAVSNTTFGAIAILGIFGTGMAFLLYFKLLKRAGAAYVSTSTFLLPIYGILLGVVLLNEQVTIWMVFGAVFILTGVAFANGKRSPRAMSFSIDKASFSKVR